MRRLALALAAAIALAGVAGAADARQRAAARDASSKSTRGEIANHARKRDARSRRGLDHRSRRGHDRRSLRGRVRSLRLGLPPGFAARPLPAPGSPAAPAPSPGPSSGPLTAPPPPPPPAPPASSGRSVQARTDDRTPAQLKLVLSRTTVLAGDVRVEFNNAFAEDPHDLRVERVDGTGAAYAFDELGPGDVQRRTLTLDVGEWRLRCTLPTHAQRGMTATLTVSG